MTPASSSIFRLREGLWTYILDSEEDTMGSFYRFHSLFTRYMYTSAIVTGIAEFE